MTNKKGKSKDKGNGEQQILFGNKKGKNKNNGEQQITFGNDKQEEQGQRQQQRRTAGSLRE